jgi:DivIVA domain-containing protein
MPLTPVEIRHVQLGRAWLRGYQRSTVDRLLEEVADSFEVVWRERADLSDRLEELESEAAKHRELEALLRATLVSASAPRRT